MWKKLKHIYHKFVGDKPGERFVNFHCRWHQHLRGSGLRIALAVTGFILIVGGIALAFIPGIPGFVLLFPGVAMIAAPFRTPSEWLDRTEVAIRRIWKKWRHRPSHP